MGDGAEQAGRLEEPLGLLEAVLLGKRHDQPRSRQTAGELTAGLYRAAALELAAREVAALVGDLRLLPERAGDQVGQRHRLGVRAQLIHGALGIVERVGVDQHRHRPEGDAADREPARVVTVQSQREHLPRGASRVRRLLASDHVRGNEHQSLPRRAPGRARGLGGDHPSSLRVGGEVGVADERELDQQLPPQITVGVRQRRQNGAQDRSRLGPAALEPEAPGEAARRIDPQRDVGRALRDAGEQARAVLRARVE